MKPTKANILILCGHTPQVVTETLYVLLKDARHHIEINRLVVLTTKTGRQCLEALLLGLPWPETPINGRLSLRYPEGDTRWERFCRLVVDRPLPLDEVFVPSFEDQSVEEEIPLTDIKTQRHDEAFADLCFHFVKELTGPEYDDTMLISSLAGGRKTMSAHLHSAMQLFGRESETIRLEDSTEIVRPHDRLIHVLFSGDYEHPDFFFPGDGTAGRAAQLACIDTSFLRLTPLIRQHPAAQYLMNPQIRIRHRYSEIVRILGEPNADISKRFARLSRLRLAIQMGVRNKKCQVFFVDEHHQVHFKTYLAPKEGTVLFIHLVATKVDAMMRDLIMKRNGSTYEEQPESLAIRQFLYNIVMSEGGDSDQFYEGAFKSVRPITATNRLSEVRNQLIDNAEDTEEARKFLDWRFSWSRLQGGQWLWNNDLPPITLHLGHGLGTYAEEYAEELRSMLQEADFPQYIAISPTPFE